MFLHNLLLLLYYIGQHSIYYRQLPNNLLFLVLLSYCFVFKVRAWWQYRSTLATLPSYNNAVIPCRNYLRRLSVCNCFIVLVFLQLTIVAFSLPLCKVINRPPLAVASLSNFAICKNAVLM
jgi:hypothetical protein